MKFIHNLSIDFIIIFCFYNIIDILYILNEILANYLNIYWFFE
jgi:hypothetical protein